MESFKVIIQTMCFAFLGLGTLIACFNKDAYFIKNGISSDKESIRRARIIIFLVNLAIWGAVLLLVNKLM